MQQKKGICENSAGWSLGPTVFRGLVDSNYSESRVTNRPETQKRGSPRDNLLGVIRYSRWSFSTREVVSGQSRMDQGSGRKDSMVKEAIQLMPLRVREKPRERVRLMDREESVFGWQGHKENLQSIYKLSYLEVVGLEEPYFTNGGGAPLEPPVGWRIRNSQGSSLDLSSKTCSNKGEKLVEDLGKTERVGNTQDPEKKKKKKNNWWRSFGSGPASPPPLRQRNSHWGSTSEDSLVKGSACCRVVVLCDSFVKI